MIEMTMRARNLGVVMTEVPITFTERSTGESKMSLAIVIEAMWLVTAWGVRKRFRR